MVGAPLLAAKAALRIGTGLVTIASTKDVTDKLEKRIEEVMTLAVPRETEPAFTKLENFITERKVSVVVVGPGLKPDQGQLVRKLLQLVDLPIIVDGGGLSAIKGTTLKGVEGRTLRKKAVRILTPHTGEFRRLVNKDLPKETEALKALAQAFAQNHQVILVLKGHPTFVATTSGDVYVNKTGGPGLATAGTGDVLTGIIAGIIAQGVESAEAAKAGVYLHGLAGDLATERKTPAGMIASDVIEFIPSALKSIE